MSSRRELTVEEWLDGLGRVGWEGKRKGAQWEGPCPKCRGDNRFHVKPGQKRLTLVSCRHGCQYIELKRAVFGDRVRGTPRPARPVDPAASGCPTCPRCGTSVPVDRTGAVRLCGSCRARKWWRDSVPVPVDPSHPARRWAAHRSLWLPREPFPDVLRWVSRAGGSIVAGLWGLPEWAGSPCKTPRAVQLIHVDVAGRPREDLGGTNKRNHGPVGGRVFVAGERLAVADVVHVAEGVADALAIAAREEGAAIAAGSASQMPKLGPELARLRRPVYLWPDGEETGRTATARLERILREHGVETSVVRIPDGEDPASWAGPFDRRPQ